MRSRVILCVAGVLALAGLAFAQDAKLTAQEIMDKVLAEERIGFSVGETTARLVIQNKQGQERTRTINIKSIEVDGLRWTLATFIEPEDVAGVKLLARERKGGESDLQYLYLPAVKEKRRIAGSEKKESFMGTDFTYADPEQKDIEEADYERLPDETHSDIPCYRINATPHDKDSDYSKLEIWIDAKDYIPLKIYFYDRSGNQVKALVARHVEMVDGRMTVTEVMMKNVQKGTRTTMHLDKLDRNKTFPQALFDENALDK